MSLIEQKLSSDGELFALRVNPDELFEKISNYIEKNNNCYGEISLESYENLVDLIMRLSDIMVLTTPDYNSIQSNRRFDTEKEIFSDYKTNNLE
ncbi:hypothetical protein J7K74_00200, partial [Candidatus Woesearchaeota archaeon]|nr:hypothetical protein [Candidatus Woesearchaeota archaeon]